MAMKSLLTSINMDSMALRLPEPEVSVFVEELRLGFSLVKPCAS